MKVFSSAPAPSVRVSLARGRSKLVTPSVALSQAASTPSLDPCPALGVDFYFPSDTVN